MRNPAPVGNLGERTLAYQCMADGLTGFVQNHRFSTVRDFEIDLAFVEARCGVEINGGIWTGGAHGRGAAILRDMQKRNLMVFEGWRVLQYTPDEVSKGAALAGLKRLLGRGK